LIRKYCNFKIKIISSEKKQHLEEIKQRFIDKEDEVDKMKIYEEVLNHVM
jgi:hypothetical protein